MAHLDWFPNGGGYESLDYRITPVVGPNGRLWRLENTGGALRRRDGRGLRPTVYSSAQEAKEHAELVERRWLRRTRATGHGIVGAIAAASFAGMVGVLTSPGRFVIGMVLFFAALRSFTHAASILWGDAWNWTRDIGYGAPVTRTDRAILYIAKRLRRRMLAASPVEEDGPVRELPPE